MHVCAVSGLGSRVGLQARRRACVRMSLHSRARAIHLASAGMFALKSMPQKRKCSARKLCPTPSTVPSNSAAVCASRAFSSSGGTLLRRLSAANISALPAIACSRLSWLPRPAWRQVASTSWLRFAAKCRVRCRNEAAASGATEERRRRDGGSAASSAAAAAAAQGPYSKKSDTLGFALAGGVAGTHAW